METRSPRGERFLFFLQPRTTIMALRRAYTQPQQGGQGFARTKKIFGVPILGILAADVGTINNQVAAFMVPKDFVVQFINLIVPSLAASALTLSIGDAANNARFVSASTAGVAGGTINTFAAGGQYYQFPADTEILLTAAAAGVTPAPGNITNFYLEGWMV
jgi:hypothetical protein